jgi:hypothetical protein
MLLEFMGMSFCVNSSTNRAPRRESPDNFHQSRTFFLGYRSFAYSDLAAMRMGMSGSASFQSVKKFS